jgi:L,D-peptidoglycan transpeptidase YkuD (ErfK/YbiS/YcfS/YnhG family)
MRGQATPGPGQGCIALASGSVKRCLRWLDERGKP